MLYHVTRSGQNYGPYTLEDLSRYVASGNILPTDMAKSDEMTEWVTVASLLAPADASAPPPQQAQTGYTETFAPGYVPPVQPGYGAPAYPPVGGAFDPPPNLNWALLMVLTFFTCSLFAMVWSIVMSAWMNRVVPASRQLVLGISVVVIDIVLSILDQQHKNVNTYRVGMHWSTHDNPATAFLGLAWLVLLIYARFNMRKAMEQYYNTVEPIGLRLSGAMTFFFGGLYFQYHMNKINDMKRAMSYGAPRPY